MKKFATVIIVIFFTLFASAQHCPWDCSGMVIIQTSFVKNKFYQSRPVLVDDNKREIVDTVYGTGSATYDEADFLSYEDFTKARTKKIAIHHWYAYDTIYHFAKGYYLAKFNYCKYQGKKLFLRFNDRYSRGIRYHYIEIPGEKRIHLHNYNDQLRSRDQDDLRKIISHMIIKLSCTDLHLRPNDCK